MRPKKTSSIPTTKTVVELDLKGYSDIAREIQGHFTAEIVGKFDEQIQSFVDAGLDAIRVLRDDAVCATTGDGAILVFDRAEHAHAFAKAVHKATGEHNSERTLPSTKRWFRIGAATGDLSITRNRNKKQIAGSVIVDAVRLETAAGTGELLVDVATYDAMPARLKRLYGAEEEVAVKGEKFRARRCVMVPSPTVAPVVPTVESVLGRFDQLSPRDQFLGVMRLIGMPTASRPADALELFQRQNEILDWAAEQPDGLKTLESALSLLIKKQAHPLAGSPDAGSAPPVSQTPIAPSIAASKLFRGRSPGPKFLIGREKELAGLDAAWSETATRNIVTIVAWGGVGKTSLVARWAASKLAQENHGGIERYFDWSFYSQGTRRDGDATGAGKAASADLFIKEALEFFGEPALAGSNAGGWQKGERLAHLVAQHRTLLILDGLEPLQDAKTGELRDDSLRALLRGLATNSRGLCLTTTRQSLPELNTWDQTAEEWKLAKLSKIAGAELLKQLGVHGTAAERKQLAEDVKGHALTLTLLGKYLAGAHGGDIRQRDLVSLSEADYEETNGHAFRVMEAYVRWFERDGREMELAILRLLGFFDRPAAPDCLAALRTTSIPGLTDTLAPLTDAEWNLAVTRLVELGLVEEQSWEPRRILGYSEQEAKGTAQGRKLSPPRAFQSHQSAIGNRRVLDSHPLIREYFGRSQRDAAIEVWRAGHRRLFEHLGSSVPYWPEGLDGLQSLYQAVAHGCEAGQYRATLAVYRSRILRGEDYYSGRNLGLVESNLATTACFFAKRWDVLAFAPSPDEAAWIYKEAGVCLRDLGRFRDALLPLERSVSLLTPNSDHELAARCTGKLSELQVALGNTEQAELLATRAVYHADQVGKPFLCRIWRAHLAEALHFMGKRKEARERLDEAIQIWREESGGAGSSADYGLHLGCGFQLQDLELSEAERCGWQVMLWGRAHATEHEKQSITELCHMISDEVSRHLEPPQELNWLFRTALDQLSIGRARLYLQLMGATVPMDTYLDSSVKSLRGGGRQDYLPSALLSRAWLRAVRGQHEASLADLDEAQSIAESGPMPLFLADVHLHRARLFVRADCATAREELKKARTLIEKHGYGRRLEELADAEAYINVGPPTGTLPLEA